MLEESIEEEYLYLQVLIMFLVLEKKVLTYEQDIKELDFYLQNKFKNKMNRLLFDFKKKLNLEHKPIIYEVYDKEKTHLVKAKTDEELKSICFLNGIEVNDYRLCLLSDKYMEDRAIVTVQELRDRKEVVIGSY